MAGRMLLIAILGLIGVTAPFIVANKIIDLFYMRTVTGTGPPLAASIAGFGSAALIAALAFYIAIQATKSLKGTSVVAEGIEEPEELPE